MKSTTCKVLIIIAFFAALIFPAIASDKVGGSFSPNENRNLAKSPTIIDENNNLSPGLKIEFEAWLKDNLAGREESQKAKAFIDLNIFDSSPSPMVHIGKAGWYFYTEGRNLEIGQGTHLLSSEKLEAIRLNQIAIQTSLEEQGIDYVLVFIPSKASVYPEFLDWGDFQVGTTLIDQVTAYLQENTSISVINVKSELINAKTEQNVYFQKDTHWNHAGAYIGYRTIITRLHELGMIQAQPVRIDKQPAMHKGDLSTIMGFSEMISPEPYEATIIQNPQASLLDDNVKTNQIKKLIDDNEITGEFFSYSNPSGQKSVLVLGDSFFFTWKIPELFAENFAEYNFLWTYTVVGDVIKSINPDIVILEISERYISSLVDTANVKLENPIQGNFSAEIVFHDTPAEVERGKSYNINILVKNTGDHAWSEDDEISLCISQNDEVCGFRINITEGVKVDSGQEYAFVLSNFQVNESDTTFLEYQMINEGYQHFGEKERVDILVK